MTPDVVDLVCVLATTPWAVRVGFIDEYLHPILLSLTLFPALPLQQIKNDPYR